MDIMMISSSMDIIMYIIEFESHSASISVGRSTPSIFESSKIYAI